VPFLSILNSNTNDTRRLGVSIVNFVVTWCLCVKKVTCTMYILHNQL